MFTVQRDIKCVCNNGCFKKKSKEFVVIQVSVPWI